VTDFSVPASPAREVDILFVVDNSPSMDPKQAALAANFPKMIQQLQQLPGGMPDVHIGVVSSDMGAGMEGLGGNCNTVLGDRGLLWGNDPTPGVRATVAPGSQWAMAAGITNGCGLSSGARWIEDIQLPTGGRQTNYQGSLTDVFACLAKGVGVGGCGYEHQLQALRLALNPQKTGCDSAGTNCTDVNMANVGFLRPSAYLAIVLVTDEDDCSAAPEDTTNDSMFLQKPRGTSGATTETGSLRCAARGHVCNGQPIPNYTDPARGYTGVGFSASLANCAAKDQLDPSRPDPHYLPLVRVQDVIDSVNAVKSRPRDQILVSGIIGWPANDDPTSVQYQIGKDPTSIKGQENLWDYMPVCTVPSVMSADGSVYKAYSGLRLKSFIDAYGQHGRHFSICNSDFTDATSQVGKAIADTMRAGCVPYRLVDTDANRLGIQPGCEAVEQVPCSRPGTGTCPVTGYTETPRPECKDDQGNSLDPASPQLDSVSNDVRPCWYLSYDTDPMSGCPDAPNGQKISTLRKASDTSPTPGTLLAMTCQVCLDSDPGCGSTPAGTGGVTGTGGTTTDTGTGGTTGTGTGPDTGLSTSTCGANASGPMTGWAWVALGAEDVITDPTCGGVPITMATPCMSGTTWNSPDACCVSGRIPALPATPTQADYDYNWGIMLGVNANADDTIPIGTAYSTIAVSLDGSPTVGLRVMLHRKGDPDGVFYCATNTGSLMKLTSFNTACWDNSGVAFTAADAPNIDKVSIQVASAPYPITVANLCLHSITFGK